MEDINLYDEEQCDALTELYIEQKSVRSQKLLTKSKFLNGLQCPKLLWMRCNSSQEIPPPSASLQNIFDMGHRVGDLATKRFAGGTAIQEEDFIKNLEETRKLLNASDPKPIYEAGIQAGRIYARADILVPSVHKSGVWDVVEVKCSTQCKDVYLQDIAFQRYCYEQAGIKVDRCYLMHVNNTYVRNGEIDPNEFFTLLDVTEEIKPMNNQMPAIVDGFLKIIDLPQKPNIAIREHCLKPYECQMKPLCWAFLPENNILQLYRGKAKGFDLLDQGVMQIKDIPDNYRLTDNQEIQRSCAISGRAHVNQPEIEGFINSLRFPLYFMDFETIFEVIPRFDGIRPYQQVPFQFSVHIQENPGEEVKHVSFLHKTSDDPRLAFIRSLKSCVGHEGTIVVYNQSFEDGRLKELGEAFEEFEEFCVTTRLRMMDLLVPFRSFHYYHPDQKGSASIKKVLPVLVGSAYEGLAIADGGKASTEYARVTFNRDISKEERLKVYEELEKYCTLDTKAMVDIMEALRKIN